MNRILTYYKKENFLLEDIFLRVTFFSNRDEIKDVGTNELFKFIQAYQPIRVAQIKEHFNKVTTRTIERWIKQLKDEDKIEFIGSKRTGGYIVK